MDFKVLHFPMTADFFPPSEKHVILHVKKWRCQILAFHPSAETCSFIIWQLMIQHDYQGMVRDRDDLYVFLIISSSSHLYSLGLLLLWILSSWLCLKRLSCLIWKPCLNQTTKKYCTHGMSFLMSLIIHLDTQFCFRTAGNQPGVHGYDLLTVIPIIIFCL